MKIAAMVLLSSVFFAGAAYAGGPGPAAFGARLDGRNASCSAATGGIAHVAYRPGVRDAASGPCCDGKLGCASLLATTRIERTRPDLHS